MLAALRRRLTYANVMATVAVFVALGGSSYAAVQLSRGAVRSVHIRDGEVRRADLARNAVTSAKVADGSLRARDFKAGELPAGARGAAGPRGETGAPGARGPAGSPDSPSAVLAKLGQVDGKGSGLDADLLDGVDAAGFARGPGRILAGRVEPDKEVLTPLIVVPDLVEVSIRCEDGTAPGGQANSRYEIRNLAAGTLTGYFDHNSSFDGLYDLDPGETETVHFPSSGPWRIDIQAGAGTGSSARVASIHAVMQNLGGAIERCRAQAAAVVAGPGG